jgi:hypothetical protein
MTARLVIHVPPQKKRARKHGKHYVSPATASLTYLATPAVGTTVSGEIDISPTSPNCSVTGVVGYLTCTISIPNLVPGTQYAVSLVTWDAAGGSGQQLSANTNVSFTPQIGQANVLSATLGGIATQFLVSPMTSGAISGSSTLMNVYGHTPVKFSVVPLDADDNIMVGIGAPQPVVSAAPAAPMALATAGPQSPNEWTLTSSFVATDPTVPSSTSISVSATPVPNSGGNTVSATIPLALYQPWIYVLDIAPSASTPVRAYDEDGNPIAGFAGFNQVPSTPISISYGGGKVYLTAPFSKAGNQDGLSAYAAAGGDPLIVQDSVSLPALGNLNFLGDVRYDPDNQEVYVVGLAGTYNVQSYDSNLTTNIASSNNGLSPRGIAYVSSTQQIAIGIASPGGFFLCDEALLDCNPNFDEGRLIGSGLDFDPYAGQLGISMPTGGGDAGMGGIQYYQLDGTLGATVGAGLQGKSTLFDPYSRRWYIGWYSGTSASGVNAFTESGAAAASFSNWPQPDQPGSITIVP